VGQGDDAGRTAGTSKCPPEVRLTNFLGGRQPPKRGEAESVGRPRRLWVTVHGARGRGVPTSGPGSVKRRAVAWRAWGRVGLRGQAARPGAEYGGPEVGLILGAPVRAGNAA
jgi:hypothetical protein